MKGLEATLGQPRVVSGGNGTNGVLEEPQFIRKGTVVSGENDGTHDDIRVTVYVFRNAVVYDVGTLEERGGVDCVFLRLFCSLYLRWDHLTRDAGAED